MNKAILIGNVGADPEEGKTKKGDVSVLLSLATRNGKDKPSSWHRIVAYSVTATKILSYVKKGDLICIEGMIDNYQYEKDGQTKYGSKIIAYQVEFLTSKNKPTETETKASEELPF